MENYYKINKDKIKNALKKNSVKNSCGREIIAKDDEWKNEIEWDEIFKELDNKKGN